MRTQPGFNLSMIAKCLVFVSLLALSINVASARVAIGVGIYGPVYAAPAPAYYAAPPTAYYAPPAPAYYPQPASVTWIPDHWEYGYWVPGHYVTYRPAPVAAPGYVWVEGRWGRHHRWHEGYWRMV
jgi:hypothetical protein